VHGWEGEGAAESVLSMSEDFSNSPFFHDYLEDLTSPFTEDRFDHHHSDSGAKPAPLVWLASYPRSGNTFVRTILYQCFGVRSASVYPNDLFYQEKVRGLTGHIEHHAPGKIEFGAEPVRLIKTHGLPPDERPAIYIVRDGRDAIVSLYHFWGGQVPLYSLVEGPSRFGTWANHVLTWKPLQRPNTLLLRYEDIVGNFALSLAQIAGFLALIPRTTEMPTRFALADGVWVRPAEALREPLAGEALERFWEINQAAMQVFGYF
jgi:hypothetical protein